MSKILSVKSEIDNGWYMYIFRMSDVNMFMCSAVEELIKTEAENNRERG